jgi:hypothetical protein
VLEAVMAAHKKARKDMQKKLEQLHITPFFTKPSLSTMFSGLFVHHATLARNIDIIPVNMNTDILMFISH